jgi:hypothetical protein
MHPDFAGLRALAAIDRAAADTATATSVTAATTPAPGWPVLPHRGPAGAQPTARADARAMLEQPRRLCPAVGVEPEYDVADPALRHAP